MFVVYCCTSIILLFDSQINQIEIYVHRIDNLIDFLLLLLLACFFLQIFKYVYIRRKKGQIILS